MSRKKQHNSKILKKKNRLNREALFSMLRRGALYGGSVVFVLWLCAWVWFGGIVHDSARWIEGRVVALSSEAGFTVETLLVEGRKNLDSEALFSLLNVERGDPLLMSDLDEMRLNIESLEWVKSVVVQRRHPNDLYVRLVERTPMVLLKNKSHKLSLLDELGTVIDVPINARFKDYVIVSGVGVEKEFYDLIVQLKSYPDLFPLVDMAEWVGERRWDLITKEGVRVQMPEDNFEQGLSRLDQIQIESALLSQPLYLVDLRQEDRVIVRPREGQSLEYNHVNTQANTKIKGSEI